MAMAWSQLRLPLALARFWGVRRGDIVSIPLQAYKDGWLTFRAGKNNALIRCPVLGEFKEIIDEAIASRPANCPDLMLCLNSRGRRWTASGLGGQFDKFFEECRERGILGPGGSLHGLRHSVGAELKAAGYTSEWRKLVLGHDTDEMSEHYAASADVDGQLIDMARALQNRPKRERSLHTRRRDVA
jgi:integrase